jgi:signal transduction histidine kinase
LAAETAEFGARNPRRAAEAYRQLAATSSRAGRARALVGLGRVLRDSGRHAEALEVYADLAKLPDIVIEGRPADLIARIGQCRVLQESGQHAQLALEAGALRTDLARGNWPITGAVWQAVFNDAAEWAGPTKPADTTRNSRFATAEALELFWRQWQEGRLAGPVLVSTEAGTGLVVWRGNSSAVRALVVDAYWLNTRWRQTASDADVDVALVDRDGSAVLGGTTGQAFTLAAPKTGLPWTIAVASAHPERARGEAAGRRRTFLVGLGVVGLLIVGSGYFTFRGIRRELAIARLHADFVSAVSHEFRTPLTSIRQLSHMLQSGRVESDRRRGQYYDVLVRETERLHKLVERFLKFGRAEAGRYRLEAVDARELVAAVAADFRQSSGNRAIELVTPEIPCPLRADREMLSLAVWNLLDNAVKYSPEDGSVRLELLVGEGRVRIAVHDQGIGIRTQDQRRIFEKFVRGSDSGTSGASGSGLGLALVDRVVRAHGGDVELESEVGRGSVFTIVLPMEHAA